MAGRRAIPISAALTVLTAGLLAVGALRAQGTRPDSTRTALRDTSRPAAARADTARLKPDTAHIARMMTEGTITYKLLSDDASKADNDILASTSFTLSLKGSRVRTDFTGGLGATSTIYSSLTHAGALLQEYGQQKILIRMNKEDFEDLGKPYRMTYTFTTDTATIAGYPCKKALGRTPAGDTLLVWYSPELLPQNRDYSYRFTPLPGLPLAYEGRMGRSKVLYQAVKVSLDPVPSAKFDIPKTGYREMTYAESKKLH